MRVRILACLLAMAALTGACSTLGGGTPIGLRTANVKIDACEMALLAGELVASNQSGLAIRNADQVTEVLWPFGYTATRGSTGAVLRDPTGKVVGREGQRIEMAGGLSANNVWTACAGTIREVSNEGG